MIGMKSKMNISSFLKKASAGILALFFIQLFGSTDVANLKTDYASGLVRISWNTTVEVNVKEFAVEKSSDNLNYHRIGTELPKGSHSSYTVFDTNPHSKSTVLYYRITVIDYDGSTRTSGYSSVSIETSGISATWGSIKALFR